VLRRWQGDCTSAPLPVPLELVTDAVRHADDWGVLLFLLAAALAGVAGYRWVRAREGHRKTTTAKVMPYG